ncbi:MAG: acyclic terpene utilization AtuA family protein [Sedimentisphaeraceae bacterium JB056]
MNEIKYLSLCGMLGYGYPTDNLKKLDDYDFIGADNGSTDPGPYYLGSGKGFVKPMQIKRDLEPALITAVEKKIPLIIGSAGGSGARPHVDSFLEIVREIAVRCNLHFKMAVIYADIEKDVVVQALDEGYISSCGNSGELSRQAIENSSHLVAQMGTEPIVEALEAGADVVIAGRCCDTAIFTAYPVIKGFDAGLALHAAKIAECGALCASPAGANDSLTVTLSEDNFVVEPTNPSRKCTPETVAAHSMYEQPNPNCFYEPEGKVDMNASSFVSCGDRGVKVCGTRLVPPEKETLKLEGASLVGYRAITIAGLRDPVAIAAIDKIETGVREKVEANLEGIVSPEEYTLNFRRYGIDAVTGSMEPMPEPLPREVGILIEAVAPTQQLADTIVSLARSTALHQPFEGRKTTAGNLAFPFSPSDVSCGAVYEFSVYHLMEITSQDNLFKVNFEEF